VLDWKAQQEHCPQGHPSVDWRPRHDVSGDPLIRIRFDGATCRACPTRQACTSARAAPRQLTVRLHTHHEAIQTAQQRQEILEFKAQYALLARVESSLSHGTRCCDLRRSRYIGLARTHLRQLLNTIAMNVVCVVAWLRGGPLGKRRRKPGHLAQLAPHPLSRQIVLC
jgi:DDE family transposase